MLEDSRQFRVYILRRFRLDTVQNSKGIQKRFYIFSIIQIVIILNIFVISHNLQWKTKKFQWGAIGEWSRLSEDVIRTTIHLVFCHYLNFIEYHVHIVFIAFMEYYVVRFISLVEVYYLSLCFVKLKIQIMVLEF